MAPLPNDPQAGPCFGREPISHPHNYPDGSRFSPRWSGGLARFPSNSPQALRWSRAPKSAAVSHAGQRLARRVSEGRSGEPQRELAIRTEMAVYEALKR